MEKRDYIKFSYATGGNGYVAKDSVVAIYPAKFADNVGMICSGSEIILDVAGGVRPIMAQEDPQALIKAISAE